MESKINGSAEAMLIKASMTAGPEEIREGAMLYGERDLRPKPTPASRFQRQLDYLHEAFERQELDKKEGRPYKRPEYSIDFVFLAEPLIRLSDMLAEYPSIQPDSDISEGILLSEEEMAQIFHNMPIPVNVEEIRTLSKKTSSIGDLSIVRGIVSEILSQSFLKSCRNSLDSCRNKTLARIVDEFSEKGFYINLLKDRKKSLQERLVLIKKEELDQVGKDKAGQEGNLPHEPCHTLIHGVPLLMPLPPKESVNCIRPFAERKHDTVRIADLTDVYCPYCLPGLSEDNQDFKGLFEATISVDSSEVLNISDPGASKIFELSELNLSLLSSSIYAEELSKKISRFQLSKKYMIEEMTKKISETNRIYEIDPYAFDPEKPIYTKPKIRHAVLSKILEEIGDEKRKTDPCEREFKGMHGETFDIRTGWMPGEEAACNIASVLSGNGLNETLVFEGRNEAHKLDLSEQIKNAVLKVTGRAKSEDIEEVKKYTDTAGRNVWEGHTPELYHHLHGRCGTMQSRLGDIRWNNLRQEEQEAIKPGGEFKKIKHSNTNFHTITDRYEFFNTLAIRKYAGFMAPFIGPAPDGISSYRIEPNLPTESLTETFADNMKESIYEENMDIDRKERIVMTGRRCETVADFLFGYSWDGVPREQPEGLEGSQYEKEINSAYHLLSPSENGSFLETSPFLNKYSTMDKLSELCLKDPEKFAKFIREKSLFERDGLNPLESAKNGYSMYLRTPSDKFELLPKDNKRIPSVPDYYEDAVEHENICQQPNESQLRPMGIEPYMEPYGSSRTGILKRPLESLRFTNTLSRDREELESRNNFDDMREEEER